MNKLIGRIFCSCLLAVLACVSVAQAQTIHLITAGDLRGFRGGAREGIQKDVANITNFFKRRVPTEQLKVTDIDGTMVSPNAIRQAVNALQAEENDTIVFYYSGHAAYDSDNGGQFFQLFDEKDNRENITRAEIRELMLRKNTRLVVLLTDCCNVFDENRKFGLKMGAMRGTVNTLAPVIDKLFFKTEGVVNITSSQVGQYSYALQDGSIFTVALIQTLEKVNHDLLKNDKVTWYEMLNQLSITANVLFKEKYPKGASPNGQMSQLPHAYEFPQLPRLGVAVMSLPMGNVRVSEVVPGMPGDKAGIKIGDVITFVNGEEVLSEPDYSRAIDSAPTVSKIKFQRDGKEMEVQVELLGDAIAPPVNNTNNNPTGGGQAIPDSRVYSGNTAPAQNGAQNGMQNGAQNGVPNNNGSGTVTRSVTPNNGPIFGASMNVTDNVITDVVPNSPAQLAGLMVGDRIVSFNNVSIQNGNDFSNAVDASEPTAILVIQKQGSNTTQQISVQLNKPGNAVQQGGQQVSPQERVQPQSQGAPIFGASLGVADNVIVAIIPNSPAATVGLEVGDRILKFNGMDIRNGQDFSQAVDASPKNAQLIIRDHRNNQEKSIVVSLNK
ncbi:MAG: PDZ domain-containing protein [Planctomycetia bacterium]|nr:PDZ domain-containing protein [Planctomycetia bacterium]